MYTHDVFLILDWASLFYTDVAGIAAGVLSGNPGFGPEDVIHNIKAAATEWGIDPRTPEAGLATTFFGKGGTRMPTKPPTLPPAAPTNSPCATMSVEIQILTDNYPSETAWTVTDQCGGAVEVASGGGYTTANNVYSEPLCLPNSKYQVEITDSWGDGTFHFTFSPR